MNIEEYQKLVKDTAVYPKELGILYPTLGLSGESGEVAEKVKKLYRDDRGKQTEEWQLSLAKELGDVLWYVTETANQINMSLLQIMEMNTKKLKKRVITNTIKGSGDNRENEVVGKDYDLP